MSVYVYSVFVLFCVQVAALRRTNPPSKEPYSLCTDYGTGKAARVHKGYRAIGKKCSV
jgi:hypothetical protein